MDDAVAILELKLVQARIDLKKIIVDAKYAEEALNRANKVCSYQHDYVSELETAIDILNGAANMEKKVK